MDQVVNKRSAKPARGTARGEDRTMAWLTTAPLDGGSRPHKNGTNRKQCKRLSRQRENEVRKLGPMPVRRQCLHSGGARPDRGYFFAGNDLSRSLKNSSAFAGRISSSRLKKVSALKRPSPDVQPS